MRLTKQLNCVKYDESTLLPSTDALQHQQLVFQLFLSSILQYDLHLEHSMKCPSKSRSKSNEMNILNITFLFLTGFPLILS